MVVSYWLITVNKALSKKIKNKNKTHFPTTSGEGIMISPKSCIHWKSSTMYTNTVDISQCNSIQFEKCCNLIGPVLTTELNYIVKCPQCNMVVAQRNQKTIEQVKPKVKQHHQLEPTS